LARERLAGDQDRLEELQVVDAVGAGALERARERGGGGDGRVARRLEQLVVERRARGEPGGGQRAGDRKQHRDDGGGEELRAQAGAAPRWRLGGGRGRGSA